MRKGKSLLAILAVVLLSFLLIAGCSSQGGSPQSNKTQAESQDSSKPAAKKISTFRIGASAVGSPVYYLGVGISELWNNKIPDIKTSVQATAGGKENLHLLGTKQLELGVDGGLQYSAYEGKDAFKEPIKNIRGVASIWPLAVTITARSDSGIEKIEQLKGKKVVVGARASAIEAIAQMVLGEYGIDFVTRKDIEPVYLGISETAEYIKNGFADVAFWSGVPPANAITELAQSGKVKFLSLDPEVIEKICQKYPQFSPFTIAKGIYPTQDYEVKTVASYNWLVAREDLDEETVYNMTKILFENIEKVAAEGPSRYMRLNTALEGKFIPLHPGAEKYYKEAGVLK